ncbi:gas vesicle protein [Streptomyces xiamenensis]|uniref:Gas vesicle protein n=1 Tax=Streptomyces xiamenensis TaxID=408015 RepID=A0A0F7G1H5_9ACTN|nr:GvpL/GvpF family gas vesicle protein [Streptomyces xiamenensis]AKG46350.1 gas vesicle protein [Streptomyces xiamenensis]
MTEPTAHRPDDQSGSTVCVFAVCPASAAPVLSGVAGHTGGGPVRLLTAGPLAVVAQNVPAADFAPETLPERLGDPAELERCARDHHAVITAVARTAPVVPFPLATLYLSDERAVAAVAERARGFVRVLDRLRHRTEWGVKVTAAPGAPAPAAPELAAAPADGRAYLARVRGRQQEREERQEVAWRTAERVYAAVRRTAVAARRLRPQDPVLGGGGPRQLLNAALLLDHHRAAELRELAGTLAADPAIARHARIEVTGPWVPYSFARLDQCDEEERADAVL